MKRIFAAKAKIEAYFFALNDSEKFRVKLLAGLVVGGLLLQFALIQPYNNYEESVRAVASAQNNQAYLIANRQIINEANAGTSDATRTTIDLRKAANTALSVAQLVPDSLANQGQNALTIAISDAPYDSVAELLNQLHSEGVSISTMQMIRLDTGIVNLTITIQ